MRRYDPQVSARRARHRAVRARRLRHGRIGAVVAALSLTLVIGGAGVVTQLRSGPAVADTVVADGRASALFSAVVPDVTVPTPTLGATTEQAVDAAARTDPPPPATSGEGRRVVFSQGQQRVWIIGASGEVERTYLVSGSKHDNLSPGTYEVTSRSRHATSYDYSGTMEFFVRFATGRTAPIGFHSVPVDNDGRLEQTKDELGTALSAGCVRQWRDDAVALWTFADLGTTVVVTAD